MKNQTPKSIKRIGKKKYSMHDQIIFFEGGSQRYINDVTHIWQNKWTHLLTNDNQEFIINPDKVQYIQRYITKDKE